MAAKTLSGTNNYIAAKPRRHGKDKALTVSLLMDAKTARTRQIIEFCV